DPGVGRRSGGSVDRQRNGPRWDGGKTSGGTARGGTRRRSRTDWQHRGDSVRDNWHGDYPFSNSGLTMATMTMAPPGSEALLGLYKRAPIELVRGDGVELFD